VAPNPEQPRKFATTRWSLVRAAGQRPTRESKAALSTLCRLTWYPVYAFIRRDGADAQRALDLTQGFFADLLERNDLATADPERGRFRTWLLACVKHFLSNERDRDNAQKRGGGVPDLSIDADHAEGRYQLEPSHGLTPEKLYDRRWTLALLDRVLSQLEGEYAARGKQGVFAALKSTLIDGAHTPYASIAAGLEMKEGAVKVAALRFRREWAALLRAEVADTIEDPADVDDELQRLCGDL
jgi:RNA polymerase sigma-70 factor (ECF subfamily)